MESTIPNQPILLVLNLVKKPQKHYLNLSEYPHQAQSITTIALTTMRLCKAGISMATIMPTATVT